MVSVEGLAMDSKELVLKGLAVDSKELMLASESSE